MVCIAAFIILSLISVFVGFLSIFNRQLGQKYWTVFKKAWHCVFKKVRLQKCDTNFKDDVKNTLLKRVVLKSPKLLKPASLLIEAISVLIVFITVWSFVIAIKSLLALWVFGTCNVSQPSQCGLGAESCSIDKSEPTDLVGKIGRSFSEWGEIFSAIPDRLKTWQEKEYFISVSIPLINLTDNSEDQSRYQTQSKQLLDFYQNHTTPNSQNVAINFVDPGCVICMQSYRNQKQSGFLDRYFTVANLYAIPNISGGYKFENSKLVTDYLNTLVFLVQDYLKSHNSEITTEMSNLLRLPTRLLDRLYAESKDNRNYIEYFNYTYDANQALTELNQWASDFGLNSHYRQLIAEVVYFRHQQRFNQEGIKNITAINSKDSKNSSAQKSQLNQNREEFSNKLNVADQEIQELVEKKIKAKGIPVELYDQKKHNGLFKL